jgi:hypothetical protein
MVVLRNVNASWQMDFSLFGAENSAARLDVFTLYVHFGFSSILSLFCFVMIVLLKYSETKKV